MKNNMRHMIVLFIIYFLPCNIYASQFLIDIFKKYDNVIIDFEQTNNSREEKYEGFIVINKPNNIAIVYNAPNPYQIIVNKYGVYVYDVELNQVNIGSKKDVPFVMILSDASYLNNFTILNSSDKAIKLQNKDTILSLLLNNNKLSGFVIKNELEEEIVLKFLKETYIKKINPNIFINKNPKIHGKITKINKKLIYD
jgi:outer membrane lipoprotein-sorting protein